MADRQAEARTETLRRWFLEAGTWTGDDYLWRNRFVEMYREVDALSVRLAQECALRAQAEQREYALRRKIEDAETDAVNARSSRDELVERAEVRLRVSDALKREYEEALTAIQAVGKHSRTVPSLQRIARDALAASGERGDTAEAGGREA